MCARPERDGGNLSVVGTGGVSSAITGTRECMKSAPKAHHTFAVRPTNASLAAAVSPARAVGTRALSTSGRATDGEVTVVLTHLLSFTSL